VAESVDSTHILGLAGVNLALALDHVEAEFLELLKGPVPVLARHDTSFAQNPLNFTIRAKYHMRS
jgi:hypothetical protein